MAKNKVTYAAGVNQVGLTASRFTADTTGGTVTLILPSIEEIQRFQERGSGLNVAGTFNFAFEKIGNGQLVFQAAHANDTINGTDKIVVNDIGSGIIFISSDNSWGIVNFSKSSNQIATSKVEVTKAAYDASSIADTIVVVPALANALVIPTHIIITLIEANGDGSDAILSYGYAGNANTLGDIAVTGLAAGAIIIVPIIAQKTYAANRSPIGTGFGVYKKSGSFSFKVEVASLDINF